MKQMADWRGARIASLVPNVLPTADAAACVTPRSCWCHHTGDYTSCCSGTRYCTSCHGRAIADGYCCYC